MSPTGDTAVLTPDRWKTENADSGTDRRADVEAKQRRIAALLQEAGCEGLLVVEPENFAWLTSGGAARGVPDASELPALYFTADQRWVIASNVDAQRLFDEELNGLGFQLKEWPWHWGREQLVADLCHNRKMISDRPFNSHKVVADQLRGLRRLLTPYEQACFQVLGPLVSHALEATCRTMNAEITEREVAAQLSHRLLHRGAQPICIEVAADGRSRRYRQCGYTSLPVRRYCVMTLTARKYGLYATSSRAVCFGEPDPAFKKEHDAACKISATYIASTWPDAMPRQILAAGQHTYRLTGFEHEWRLCPQGHITGRLPVEMNLLPSTEQLFQANWGITWHASVGAAFSTDTFLISEEGPRLITPPEAWPLKRIKIQGAEFFRPDLLLR
ncbi:MAG TPA: M24 family metallopeptidase [Gemmataceae bacterium]|nr:M24 family metallopeptidase [Gemmataceae bacterium]